MTREQADIVASVRAFVATKFDGNPEAAFNAYAQNGALSVSDVREILMAAEAEGPIRVEAIAFVERFGSNFQVTWPQVQVALEALNGTAPTP